ncbi:hypothetical protein CK203_071831 [Vitis vinifera]|uniref:Uncharacterized protein n=1 Tax=Vitis vinifera TaxID=29760 RepID=A0A438C3D3_VITVI|nr:hypothetical protein CK203_071831 [Vitis vinifera]
MLHFMEAFNFVSHGSAQRSHGRGLSVLIMGCISTGLCRGAMLVKTLFHWILMEASDHLFPWKEILNSVAPSMSPFLIPVHHITIDLLVQQGEILPKTSISLKWPFIAFFGARGERKRNERTFKEEELFGRETKITGTVFCHLWVALSAYGVALAMIRSFRSNIYFVVVVVMAGGFAGMGRILLAGRIKGVLNSSDKSKPKTVVRTSDMIAASKTGQQQPSSSHLANHSLRGHVRSDPPTTSHGKFLVLKPARENGASPTSRDVSSPTNNASSRVASIQLGVAHSVASAPSISPNYPKLSTMERKAAALSLNSGPTAEKRPSFSQAQSRHDFFNLMRKKTSVNSSAVLPDSGPAISSSNTESEVSSAPVKSHAIENGGQVTGNGGNTCEEVESPAVGEKHLGTNASICPDEEEAAFLRSLGWEESAGDDEGLTEEEINAFYQEYMKLKPSLKLQQGMQAKLLMLHGSRTTSLGGASSKLSSSDSESEA